MELEELSLEEMMETEGGTGFWYDVAYAVGITVRAAEEISNSLRSDSRYGNAAIYK